MTHTDVDQVRAFYTALRRLDLAAMFDVLTPDVRIRHSALLPWSGDERGYAGP